MAPQPRPISDRFWEKVDKTASDGCWEWTAARLRTGYGYFFIKWQGASRGTLAHRVAFELTHGPITNDLFVCHKCDNPGCVNPAHLFLGTTTDNMRDASKKGRTASGPRNGASTKPERVARGSKLSSLSDDDIRTIRSLAGTKRYERKVPQKELAARFNVSQSNISMIVSRKNWRHL